MKKPVLRVTKWLGTIPIEAECTACADAKFQVRASSHRPNLAEYQKALQSQFDASVTSISSGTRRPQK